MGERIFMKFSRYVERDPARKLDGMFHAYCAKQYIGEWLCIVQRVLHLVVWVYCEFILQYVYYEGHYYTIFAT